RRRRRRDGAQSSPERNDTEAFLKRTAALLVRMSTLHFIGGEKGGVGKSVMSRLAAQYCIDRAIAFVGVDADASNRTLLRFYAEYTRPVDLSRIESIDEIIALATEMDRRVLVDLPAQGERTLSAWIAEAGVFDLARESGINIVFWHVMDD